MFPPPSPLALFSFRDNAKAIAKRIQDVPKEPTAQVRRIYDVFRVLLLSNAHLTDPPPAPLMFLQAADWVEYVIRHDGAGHLRLSDLDNSFHVRMGFDVIAALVAVALSPLLILYLCCRCIGCRRSKEKKE